VVVERCPGSPTPTWVLRTGFARALVEAWTVAELRRRALAGLAELVPANAAGHPLLSAHAARRRPALRLSDAVEPRRLHHNELYADLLHPPGVEYCITIVVRTERREMVVAGVGRTEREFSERDRDVLDLVRPALEGALRDAEARERLVPALANQPAAARRRRAARPLRGDRAFEPRRRALGGRALRGARAPGWLPGPVAEWLALPRRLPLISERDGRLLSICPLTGDPHTPRLEEKVASFRTDALDRLGPTARETEALRAATVMENGGRHRLGAVHQPSRRLTGVSLPSRHIRRPSACRWGTGASRACAATARSFRGSVTSS
jgi:hypothetical protein